MGGMEERKGWTGRYGGSILSTRLGHGKGLSRKMWGNFWLFRADVPREGFDLLYT